MKPKDAAEKAKLSNEAATWMQRASLVGGAPSWAALLAATILRKEGRDEAAVRHLEQVYYSTSDEKTRAEVRNRLVSLKAKVDFERESRERARFEDAWQADLPYLKESMYVLVGPPRSPNLDWRTLGN
jgi:hypothetical protein